MAVMTDPYIGRTLDKRYRVDRLIGRGGMGAVYEAHHIGLDRKVAVKFVLGGDADAKARFKREARAASKIDHDHVVHIYDVGVDETGVDFIAMELVEGTDLKNALEAGPFEPARALHIARQLVAGLGAVHEAGIVHRDIKPANIMLTEHDDERDFVKIMDFGISKAVDRSGTSITLAGRVVGTPAYMAPEQLTGDDADPRSDLYAAALVIYEMLAGAPPIRGDNTDQLVEKRLREHPARLDEVNPSLPVEIARVIDRALDVVAAQRYQTADAFLAALDISVERGRLDSKTVAIRPAPSELPTAQLTPATALDRPRPTPSAPPANVTAPRTAEVAVRRPRWPLVLATLLVLGVPLGVFVAMKRDKPPAATPAPNPPPIAVTTDPAVPSESAKLLAAARAAEREGRAADALAAYRRYLEAEPNAPDATSVVERIAALAPPAPTPPPLPPIATKKAKPNKNCMCISAEDVSLCKETRPMCRCEVAHRPLCAVKPQSGPCSDGYTIPMITARVGMMCAGYLTWTTPTESRGTINCHFCPEQPNRAFRGHQGEACVGYNAINGARTPGTLYQCE